MPASSSCAASTGTPRSISGSASPKNSPSSSSEACGPPRWNISVSDTSTPTPGVPRRSQCTADAGCFICPSAWITACSSVWYSRLMPKCGASRPGLHRVVPAEDPLRPRHRLELVHLRLQQRRRQRALPVRPVVGPGVAGVVLHRVVEEPHLPAAGADQVLHLPVLQERRPRTSARPLVPSSRFSLRAVPVHTWAMYPSHPTSSSDDSGLTMPQSA